MSKSRPRRSSGSGGIEHALGGRTNALAAAMLLACLLLGGGGTSNPWTEVLLQLTLALLVLAATWWPRRRRSKEGQAMAVPMPGTALAIAALVLTIPVVQLIPLPPALWHSLPGRQAEMSSLGLIGKANRWMPFTVAPAATFAALLAILTEVVVFVCLARIDTYGKRALCWVIAGVAVASVVLGCLQISQPGGLIWSLYGESSSGWVIGFQANRNAETDVLQIGVLALAAIIAGNGQRRDNMRATTLIMLVLVMLGLALGAVLTGSRTGLGLLPLTYLFVIWILWPIIARSVPRTPWGWFAAFCALLLVPSAICLALARTERVQHVLERFDQAGEHRWDIWHDTITAIGSVWPLGGGIGSFPVLFDASQSIERLATTLDLRAHNDWLEWVLEAGVPGIFVLALVGTILVICNIRALNRALRRNANPDYRATVIFATATLLHVGLHAIFDYPMRSMALAALVAAAAAMLMPFPTGALPPGTPPHTSD